MKRTTVFLDEETERELDYLSRERGEPKSMLIREALAEYVARRQPARKRTLAFIASGDSGRSDIAERHEELLWKSPGHSKPALRSPKR